VSLVLESQAAVRLLVRESQAVVPMQQLAAVSVGSDRC
jgi:hypothetical protein